MDDRHDESAGDAVDDDAPTAVDSEIDAGGSDAPSARSGQMTAVSTALDGGPIVDLDALDGALIAERYQVAQIVSLGSNTVIVDAHDTRAPDPLAHPVTIKVVRPHLVARPDFLPKFRVLADLSQALTHPNISSVLDWGELEVGPPESSDATVFWVVDALGGGSLRDLLDRGRTITPGQALVVGLEACRALDAAHQRGLFHTELTPSKMVFGADRRLRIVDFGLARLLAEETWESPANVPTDVALYASPEQAIGLPVDAKTDVYALALVLVESVTGDVPFAADSTVATLAGRVDKLLPVSADLGALAAVLERAARPEAADRYTAAEFGRALVQVANKLPRPEPIPILSTGMLDSTGSAIRRPTDPTGGVERPDDVDAVTTAVAGGAAVVESDPEADDESDTEDDGSTPAGPAVAAGAAAVAATAGAAAAIDGVGGDAPVADGAASAGDDDDESSSASSSESSAGDGNGAGAAATVADGDASSVDPSGDVEDPAVVETDESSGEEGGADDAQPDEAVTPPVETDDGPSTPPRVTAGDDLHFTDEVIASAPPTGTAEMPAAVVQPVPEHVAPAEAPTLYDDAPTKRRKGPIVLIVVVLIAGLVALGYAATLLFQPNSFAVPVLAGQPVDRALNQIAGNGWEISYEFERSDSFPEPEQVIRTEPEPGVELEEGEPFLIVLSEGPEFRILPEVSGLTFEDAAAQLAALGLNAAEAPERVFSETLPPGSVVAWQVVGNATLAAGQNILPGETVQLTLSQGPEPRTVPPLDGLTLNDAVARAEALQLQVVSGDGVFSDDVPEGLVVSQVPAEGAALERGGTITVQLSLGPDVVPLPALDGLTFAEAQTLLTESGFVIGRLLGTTDGVFVELTIDGQEVEPGTEFPRGQVVDVIFL